MLCGTHKLRARNEQESERDVHLGARTHHLLLTPICTPEAAPYEWEY